MIFISHTHSDKPVVEPIAVRLASIFGAKNVFYDSWSMQPGDGIIDKMNQGLADPQFVFFFVSNNSLKSNMVKLEWQNALFKATHGQCKIVPVRVDGCAMPPILLQSLYIDLFAHGIEAAIVQITNVIQGNTTFTPMHLGFSNLTANVSGNPQTRLDIVVAASHLMEPNPDFLVLVQNNENEIRLELNGGQPHRGGFNKDVRLDNGRLVNAIAVAPLGGAITPAIPIKIAVIATGVQSIQFLGLMHRTGADQYSSIPLK